MVQFGLVTHRLVIDVFQRCVCVQIVLVTFWLKVCVPGPVLLFSWNGVNAGRELAPRDRARCPELETHSVGPVSWMGQLVVCGQ